MTIIMDKLAKLVNNAWHFTKNSRCPQLKVKLFSFRQFLVTQDSIQLIDGLNKYFFFDLWKQKRYYKMILSV